MCIFNVMETILVLVSHLSHTDPQTKPDAFLHSHFMLTQFFPCVTPNLLEKDVAVSQTVHELRVVVRSELQACHWQLLCLPTRAVELLGGTRIVEGHVPRAVAHRQAAHVPGELEGKDPLVV